ncbi:GRF1-interacting factor 2-like [Iris pallida]|uniref:GRF1-interacting factor 2-like n=1 Tax=Iris pallida TaxID=29817 RepID=A0AAX6F7P2_IRIPA|nr:GRF1-interacting factor 2-like [Iris pallida]KAJ6812442.1 GRF1-interacting factor 2-like [Iris pallida]
MQQHQQMPAMGTMAPVAISTEQIQKYLDENKQLILAILDNQNLGKLSECAQYQAQLQKNLLYLAAIADSQPPTTVRPQVMPHSGMHQAGGLLMQQAPMFRPHAPLQFNPQEIQEQQQQLHPHPQMMPFQGHLGMRPVGLMNGLHAHMNSQPSHGGGSSKVLPGGQNLAELSRGSTPSSSVDGRGSKQDAGGAASQPHAAPAAEGQKSAATEHPSGEAKPSGNPKRPEGAEAP